MKKMLAVFLFLAFTASMTLAADGSWTGWITDAKCAPKLNADCAKKCAEKGEKMVLSTPTRRRFCRSQTRTHSRAMKAIM